MTKKRVALHNLGCKVNLYEYEAAVQMLKKSGYEIVPFEPGADIYIINTCTVTNIADRKSRQMLHKAKKMNPDAIVIAMGCYAQTDRGSLEKDDTVDIILGNNKKSELIEVIEEYEKNKNKTEYIDDLKSERSYEELHVSESGEHIRGFMKVQDGCDRFCSYCIIPYARGRVRSRRVEDAYEEAERLAGSGCAEIVLSGIHLSSYGKDLKEDIDLLTLIKKIHEIDKIKRIRLGSLEPGIITEEFVCELSKLKKVCPHFHLSLQSGCDKILKLMNRHYTSDEYAQKCEILRRYYSEPSLTTDIITGFPSETDEDFEETYKFADSIGFFEIHVFPYSKRKGTKAAEMPGQLTEAVKKERASRLIELNKKKYKEHMKKLIGNELNVLFEEQIKIDDKTYWTGHTSRYEKVVFESQEDEKNKIKTVTASDILNEEYIVGK